MTPCASCLEAEHEGRLGVATQAVRNGHVECLAAVLSQLEEDERPGDAELASLMTSAAHHARIDVMRYLWDEHRPPEWMQPVCAMAARARSLECLRFAHERGAPLDYEHGTSLVAAAKGGSVECMRYAVEHGSATCCVSRRRLEAEGDRAFLYMKPLICEAAADFGQIDCLRLAHELGLCDEWGITCVCAVLAGSLECLEYAASQGAPWDGPRPGSPYDGPEATCEHAALHGDRACLAFAASRGAPLGRSAYLATMGDGHIGCVLEADARSERLAPWPESESFNAWTAAESRQCAAYIAMRTGREAQPLLVGGRHDALARRLRSAVAAIEQRWLRRRAVRAVRVIENAWIEVAYRPGGVGARRCAESFASGSRVHP